MSVYLQKGSRNWWISIYRHGKRRYIPSGTDDKAQATALEGMLKAAMRGNLERERLFAAIDALMGWDAGAGVDVSQLWVLYLQSKPRISEHTLKIREGLCHRFMDWVGVDFPTVRFLQEVSPQVAQAFVDHMEATMGGRGKTQNTRLGHLGTVFKAVAVRAGMNSNPFDLVKRVAEEDSLTGRPFTQNEQQGIFKQCEVAGNGWKAACVVAKYTGMRLKDIALLDWSQVGDRAIDVTPAKTKRYQIRVLIPIHPAVAAALSCRQISGPVFPVLHSRCLKGKNRYLFKEEVLGAVKIDSGGAKISFHCWRHTFRTMMAEAAVPQDIAMKLGGWTNESTAAIYNHFDDFERLSGAIALLE